jgi:hypothetical protein
MLDTIGQQIDATTAQALHKDACRNHPLVAWVIWQDHPAHPDGYVAQLTTTGPLPYLLVGGSLSEIQRQLPPGLVRHTRDHG